jgi:hypothetical protein
MDCVEFIDCKPERVRESKKNMEELLNHFTIFITCTREACVSTEYFGFNSELYKTTSISPKGINRIMGVVQKKGSEEVINARVMSASYLLINLNGVNYKIDFE